jgi:hypothetical protein
MNPFGVTLPSNGSLKVDPSLANVIATSTQSDDEKKSAFPMVAVAGLALVALLLLSRSKK